MTVVVKQYGTYLGEGACVGREAGKAMVKEVRMRKRNREQQLHRANQSGWLLTLRVGKT